MKCKWLDIGKMDEQHFSKLPFEASVVENKDAQHSKDKTVSKLYHNTITLLRVCPSSKAFLLKPRFYGSWISCIHSAAVSSWNHQAANSDQCAGLRLSPSLRHWSFYYHGHVNNSCVQKLSTLLPWLCGRMENTLRVILYVKLFSSVRCSSPGTLPEMQRVCFDLEAPNKERNRGATLIQNWHSASLPLILDIIITVVN